MEICGGKFEFKFYFRLVLVYGSPSHRGTIEDGRDRRIKAFVARPEKFLCQSLRPLSLLIRG